MRLVVIGLRHHPCPVTVRERFAFAEAKIPAALELLRQAGIVQEAVILSTCNRVEIYAATDLPPTKVFAELEGFLLKCADYHDLLTDSIYRLTVPRTLEHLFK